MLNKHLSRLQWLSLIFLFVGVAVVQLQPTQPTPAANAPQQSLVIGLSAVCVGSLMSGFAGVYFEKLLKHTSPSIFLRNVQLGVIGIVFGLVTMYANDGSKIDKTGFFFGYDGVVWFIISLQAFSGLLVAVVVKYADNILKGFATSAAIVISCILSMYFFDFQLSAEFIIGSTLVIVATYMYSRYPVQKAMPFESKFQPVRHQS